MNIYYGLWLVSVYLCIVPEREASEHLLCKVVGMTQTGIEPAPRAREGNARAPLSHWPIDIPPHSLVYDISVLLDWILIAPLQYYWPIIGLDNADTFALAKLACQYK